MPVWFKIKFQASCVNDTQHIFYIINVVDPRIQRIACFTKKNILSKEEEHPFMYMLAVERNTARELKVQRIFQHRVAKEAKPYVFLIYPNVILTPPIIIIII